MMLNRRTTPSIDALQAFECAARHGSFTRAGNELNLTQSAVSRKIRDLELQLGVVLFDRARQRVALSHWGKRFLIDVRTILRQTEEAMLRTMASASADSSLSIATLPTFGNRWLLPRLPRFLASFPRTALNLSSHIEPFDFAEEPFDVAIHFGQPVWAKATCIHLCNEIMVPIVGANLAADTRRLPTAILEGMTLLHLTTRPRAWEQWATAHGFDIGEPYRGHRFDQFMMMIEAVKAGIGVALVPRFAIEAELRAGAVVAITDHPYQSEGSYFAIVPDGKTDAPIVRAFVDWLKSEMPADTASVEDLAKE
jgi:LysR family glycine cleavage system transcriptional activator